MTLSKPWEIAFIDCSENTDLNPPKLVYPPIIPSIFLNIDSY